MECGRDMVATATRRCTVYWYCVVRRKLHYRCECLRAVCVLASAAADASSIMPHPGPIPYQSLTALHALGCALLVHPRTAGGAPTLTRTHAPTAAAHPACRGTSVRPVPAALPVRGVEVRLILRDGARCSQPRTQSAVFSIKCDFAFSVICSVFRQVVPSTGSSPVAM